MQSHHEEEMTRLGVLALLPLALAAISVWASPWAVPAWFALDFHRLALAYAGVVAAYLIGIGAGGALTHASQAGERFLPGMIGVLVAWLAVWDGGLLFFRIPAVWRYVLVIGVLFYVFARDLSAVRAGLMPAWYGALRTRLTLWATAFLAAITLRLLIWGHY